MQDIRELIASLRKHGKRVIAWAPFYTTDTYYIACACDEILLLPTGNVMPLGFRATGMFLADALARVGIKADFVQVSPYKSAADVLTKSRMSDELREQVTWLLQSQHDQLVEGIAAGRKLDATQARELIDSSPYDDSEAVVRHAVDAVISEEEIPERLGAGVTIGDWDQARRKMPAPAPKFRRGRYIALMRIEGTILDGRSGRPPIKPPIDLPVIGDARAGDLTVVQLARQIAHDRNAAAAVLYVNSRGGSSTASQAMFEALETVAARKPLVVVMGPVAGSGGYLVAMPGRWVIARPGTLTGSIGVLTGKLVTSGLWDKLTATRETIAMGRHATLESDERLFSPEERQIVESQVGSVYRSFLNLVANSRHLERDAVLAVADGKVWTGAQALERKLIDELGGVDAGIAKARALASLPDAAPAYEVQPPKRSAPPRTLPTAAALAAYVLEGIRMLNVAPALAVMNLTTDVHD
jgi:protease-4